MQECPLEMDPRVEREDDKWGWQCDRTWNHATRQYDQKRAKNRFLMHTLGS